MKKKFVIAVLMSCMLVTSACGKEETTPVRAEDTEAEQTETAQEVEATAEEAEPKATSVPENNSGWETKVVTLGEDCSVFEFDRANHTLMPTLSVNLPVACELVDGYAPNGDIGPYVYSFITPISTGNEAKFNFGVAYSLNSETAYGYDKEMYESAKEDYGRYIFSSAFTEYGGEINVYDAQTNCSVGINISYTDKENSIPDKEEYHKYVEDNIAYISQQVSEWSQDFEPSAEWSEIETVDLLAKAQALGLSDDEGTQNHFSSGTYVCDTVTLEFTEGGRNEIDTVVITTAENDTKVECYLVPIGEGAWQACLFHQKGTIYFDFCINEDDGSLDVQASINDYSYVTGTYTEQ